jgi:toxin ParE1/3/4
MVKITWTAAAIEDLKEIFDFIAEDSIRYAIITTSKIYQTVEVLAYKPRLGRMVPEFNEKFIRELIANNYRIIYRIKSDTQVDILRVYHSARLLRRSKIK